MKKNMKITFLALVLTVALLAAGCSGSEENVGGTLEQAPNAAETQTPAEEAPQVALGRLEGGVYTNSYTGYGCELDASWAFYSAEELQDIPENISEMLSDSELLDSETALSQITDMMAENVEQLCTMNVLYQKLGMQERLAYALMDEEAVLEAVLSQKDAMADAYAQAGIIVETMETKQVTFLGEERLALHTSSTMDGVPYYTLQVFDFDLGAYAVTLTVASYVEDQTESLLELYYAVE